MNPDELKQAWQSQSPRLVTIDADLLLNEVRRNQRSFATTIYWRDLREIGVGVVLVPLLIYMGVKLRLPWTWYLAVPAVIWVAGFMLIDRIRHKPPSHSPGQSLRQTVESSLAQVSHQIWLLRNVLWWYLLPLMMAGSLFFIQLSWQMRSGGWPVVLAMGQFITLNVVVFAFVYWLNQRAVRAELEPRRQELAELLANLSEEIPGAPE